MSSTATRTDDEARQFKATPRLRVDVAVHAPQQEEASWVVQEGEHRYLRIGADLAALMRAMDGTRDHATLAGILGPRWTAETVGSAVDQLWDTGLLSDGRDKPRRARVVKYEPPLTLQLTVLRPERLLRVLHPVIRALGSRPAQVIAVLLLVAGGVAALAQGAELHAALSRPLPLGVILSVIVVSYATTVLHEFAHGAVLTYYGGRPTRMGVMLFYLLPAFFCDVSDAWRLPRPDQRVRIALAGVALQWLVAATAFLTAAVAQVVGADDAVHAALLVLGVSVLVSGLLNLIPLIKLDGYIALMSHVDIPQLRPRAIALARQRLSRVLFGQHGPTEEGLPRWAEPYGWACLVFPLALVAVALGLWADMLIGAGVVGAAIVALLVLAALYRLAQPALTAMKEARKAGAGLPRIAAGASACVAAAVALAALVQVPYEVAGGFVQRDGQTLLVLPTNADLDAVTAGDPVRLEQHGFVTHSFLGRAEVQEVRTEEVEVPVTVFVPLIEEEPEEALPLPADAMPLTIGDEPGAELGGAVVETGSRPLGEWVYLRYIVPLLRS